MHHIHRTKALILKNSPTKETDSVLTLITYEFGLIYAIAQGSRKLESKMRQSIQVYSVADVALVSGRSGWRLVNAIFNNNFFTEIKEEKVRDSILRPLALVDRLLAGEMQEILLFDLIISIIDFAIKNSTKISEISDFDKNLEIIFTAQILQILGYWRNSEFSKYTNEIISIELLSKFSMETSDFKKNMIKEINNSIRDSNL